MALLSLYNLHLGPWSYPGWLNYHGHSLVVLQGLSNMHSLLNELSGVIGIIIVAADSSGVPMD